MALNLNEIKELQDQSAKGFTAGQGFKRQPKAKSDRPATHSQPEAPTAARAIATDEPFDLTPVIAAAAELVGQDAVDARLLEYREDELTDQEIGGYLPRWAARKASKINALAVADKSNKTIVTTQKTGLENAAAFIGVKV